MFPTAKCNFIDWQLSGSLRGGVKRGFTRDVRIPPEMSFDFSGRVISFFLGSFFCPQQKGHELVTSEGV